MKKFEKVKEALEEKTYNTYNFITLKRGVRDTRDNKSIKFHTVNVITNNTQTPFMTLNDVIKSYELNI